MRMAFMMVAVMSLPRPASMHQLRLQSVTVGMVANAVLHSATTIPFSTMSLAAFVQLPSELPKSMLAT